MKPSYKLLTKYYLLTKYLVIDNISEILLISIFIFK